MSLRQYCLAIAAGLAIAFGARAANVQESPVLLVAKPELSEFYRDAVLFARPVGDGRHIGFIVNRPTPITMAQIFPGHVPSRKVTEPIFLGGPLHSDHVFAVVRRAESPGGRTVSLAEDLFLVIDASTVDRVIEQNRDDTRFYAGLVLWQPGELEAELQRGFWYVLDHDTRLVFRKPIDGLWEELVSRSRRTL